MLDFIVNPISIFIGVIFTQILSLIKVEGLALIALSIVVNIILFPLYYFAERIEKKEKEVQAKMKPKIDEFKSVYKGYELHLYTSNVYRLNNYHPAYSLRGLISLLIQIPFFMGAYHYLSSYTGFEGVSFLFISNLANPDALINIGKFSINILPFVMTGINLWSGYIYAKNGETSEKITIIIAIFFLVILYNSPASLLIYWTFNNVFSLIKNIITKRIEDKKNIEENL